MTSPLVERANAVRRGEASAAAHVESILDRIRRLNPSLNAYREVFDEQALRDAEAIDARTARGEDPGPLAGQTIAVKDSIATLTGRTTCGSRLLETYASPFEATAVARLRAAGAIVVGKTNCDEFGMGSTSEYGAFGAVHHPIDATRTPGGSSGGSAAAVAAGLCDAALGSDTGGSIRQPAAFCGVAGLKPNYGRVSRYGLVAFASSLEQIGPLTATAADGAAILEAIAGPDPHDSTCSAAPVEPMGSTTTSLSGVRIGVAQRDLDACDPVVAKPISHAIEALRAAGATIDPLDLPLSEFAIATYYVIAPAEASANLARFDGIRFGRRADGSAGADIRSRTEGFGREVQRRIMLGTFVLSEGYADAYYDRALRARRLIREMYRDAFARCDAIIGPTTPTPAFELGADLEPMAMYQHDRFTVGANLSGHPAMSIPCGHVNTGDHDLPVGLHIQCPPFAERSMIALASWLERLAES